MVVKPEVRSLVRHDGELLGLARTTLRRNSGLIRSTDQGQTWTAVAGAPYNRFARTLLSTGGTLELPTTSGGIYTAGRSIPLDATVLQRDLDEPELVSQPLGLSITFDGGSVELEDVDGDGIDEIDEFAIVAQDYQGWIVWRAQRGDEDDMVMIGRYDKNNPETCIEGFCGDESFVILPNCFAERRAACFDLSTPGFVSFYDEDIYNGFTYSYAVTPFDYGDVSTVEDIRAFNTPMVFPPRFPEDEYSSGEGQGNRFEYQVNEGAAAPEDGDEIYVYPNPLRLDAGIVGGEGEEVIWTNLPPRSRVQIFTLAGDDIAELPRDGDPQQGANMYWVARNQDNQLLASGIYVWRVIMEERGDYWGKLVIIR